VSTLGVALMTALVGQYYLKYCTDVLLVRPAIAGAIVAAARVWDALWTPIVGHLSDGTRAAFGRRRSWIVGSMLPLCAAFVLLWSPLATGSARPAAVALALLVFYSSVTAFVIPHVALCIELSVHDGDRASIFAWRHVAWTAGALASLAAIRPLVHSTPAAASRVTVPIALATAAIVATNLFHRERREYQGRASTRFFAALREVFRSPRARALLYACTAEAVALSAIAALTPYVTDYVVGRADATPLVLALFILSAVGSLPVWARLAGKFSAPPLWTFALALMIAALSVAAIFVHRGSIGLMAACAALAGASGGAAPVLVPLMQARLIDEDEANSGERREGAYIATFGFFEKALVGIPLALFTGGLELSGFHPNAVQTDTTLLVIRAVFAGLPAALLIPAAVVLMRSASGPLKPTAAQRRRG
jgi:Na+/melibiose symporter-like transporter